MKADEKWGASVQRGSLAVVCCCLNTSSCVFSFYLVLISQPSSGVLTPLLKISRCELRLFWEQIAMWHRRFCKSGFAISGKKEQTCIVARTEASLRSLLSSPCGPLKRKWIIHAWGSCALIYEGTDDFSLLILLRRLTVCLNENEFVSSCHDKAMCCWLGFGSLLFYVVRRGEVCVPSCIHAHHCCIIKTHASLHCSVGNLGAGIQAFFLWCHHTILQSLPWCLFASLGTPGSREIPVQKFMSYICISAGENT